MTWRAFASARSGRSITLAADDEVEQERQRHQHQLAGVAVDARQRGECLAEEAEAPPAASSLSATRAQDLACRLELLVA